MNLLLRLFWIIARAFRRTPLGPLDLSTVDMRVWPTDLDIQIHMNNGRFLSIMDLGRIDLLVRSGFYGEARRRGWFPLMGGVTIEYRRSLHLFQRYQLTTRLVGWDERWFFMRQEFIAGEKLYAGAWVKAMIYGPNGPVPTAEALTSVGFTAPSPPLPDGLAHLTAPRGDVKIAATAREPAL